MVVAAGAVHGQPQQTGGHGIDPVEDVTQPVFLRNGAPLAGHGVHAQKGRGHAAIVGRCLDQVARQLVQQEGIVRHILPEGIDDPVAVGGTVALPVGVQAMAIGVPGHVQPFGSHPFGVSIGSQQLLHLRRVGFRTGVGKPCIQLLQRGR